MDPNKRTRLFSTLGIVIVLGVLGIAGYRMVTSARDTASSWISRESGADEQSGTGRFESDGTQRSTLDLGTEGLSFDRIEVRGSWRITLEAGAHAVSTAVPTRVAKDVDVSVRGDTLVLSVLSGLPTITGTLNATVTAPSLRYIDIDGGGSVDIRDLESPELTIDIDGAADVRADGSRIERLVVDVDGAANVDFGASHVVDARIDLDGAANLAIRMDGGELTGAISGVGNVEYSGTVSRESIRVDGLGRVRSR